MKRRIILYMTINYIFSLGTCSANKITYDPLNKNFKNSLPCGKIRLWIGEGDICLCADEERRIVGLSGNLDTVADITDDAIVLPTVTDGVVTAEFGIKSFEGVIVSIECIGARRNGERIAFGDVDGDIFVRVSQNLYISLRDGKLCGIVVTDCHNIQLTA